MSGTLQPSASSNIIWFRQLFNSNGVLFSHQEFLQQDRIPVTRKPYAIVFNAIPLGVLMLFKSTISVSVFDVPFTDVTDPSGCKNNFMLYSKVMEYCYCILALILETNNAETRK